ncbi:MAG TPA: ASPIC/UnbV domain-containing protein, partial [Gemmatimonadales bacterium]|nr:ASPIC/UnbV domain-containing protein [Gemmatimonadales bacterium]
ARVQVKAGGQTLTQWNDGKSGYLSQSSMPLYFGLGDARKIDSVEVTWPSGKTQTVAGPKANGEIEVVEK